jgi:hypothetical protein
MWRRGYGACCCSGPGLWLPPSREEFVRDLEEYKAALESEILALEKRIHALKEKAA